MKNKEKIPLNEACVTQRMKHFNSVYPKTKILHLILNIEVFCSHHQQILVKKCEFLLFNTNVFVLFFVWALKNKNLFSIFKIFFSKTKKPMVACTSKTLKGLPCKNSAIKGQKLCFAHLEKELGKMIPDSKSPKKKSSIVRKTNLTKPPQPVRRSVLQRDTEDWLKYEMARKADTKIKPTKKGSSDHPTSSRRKSLLARDTEENSLKKPSEKVSIPLMLSSPVKYNNALIRMQNWFDSVEPDGYRFPHWIIDLFKHNKSIFDDLCSKVLIYTTHDDDDDEDDKNKKLVLKLATEREPVNIAKEQFYNKAKFHECFGWTDGLYDRYYKSTGKLAPNIAVFTPSVFLQTKFHQRDFYHQKMIKELVQMNIFHVIGFAMDDKKQTDYKYLTTKVPLSKRSDFLFQFYFRIFKMIFECAMNHYFRIVVLPPVGLGHFSSLYDGDLFKTWRDALMKAISTYTDATSPYIRLQLMGFNEKDAKILRDFLSPLIDFEETIGYFPQCVPLINLSNSLIVNAWDPLSAPGNGCFGDHSLDGAIGATTTCAVVGNGALNPFMGLDRVKIVK